MSSNSSSIFPCRYVFTFINTKAIFSSRRTVQLEAPMHFNLRSLLTLISFFKAPYLAFTFPPSPKYERDGECPLSAVEPKSVSVWSSPWCGICFSSTCWRNPQSCFASATAIIGFKLSDVVAPPSLSHSHSLHLVHSLRSARTLSRLVRSLTPPLPTSPLSSLWVGLCIKQMNVLLLAVCQRFWEVISLNTAVPLFIFVTFCSLLHLKRAVVGGI